ncbi:hypothetical protein AKJ62_00765 [candidate division MSBL1 archaeon SCGC-AAA259D14]|uniref:PepSY domain-containing protein n=2 Tax=candidate division MSBL1 TaxID=215777 RepID=A0A133U8F2_9EURY|nr:hypothetical protein AKJ62_00765 [candidate division MSBL1 archaeon SCGC-AAA259D14]KXA93257.1 hypothetical protein AKJ66_02465 [candidate division MSBL1 archaeon SCGC-AAA259E22]
MAVENAREATQIARDFAEKDAGLVYSWVDSVKKKGNKWIVQVSGIMGNFMVKIDAKSGEVISYERVEQT